MAPLATLDDFARLGLPPAALVPPPRPIEAVDASTDRFLARGHGLIAGDELRFETPATLPAPLAALTTYVASPVDLDLFEVKYKGGPFDGQIVDLTTAGELPLDYRVDPRPIYLAALAAASSTVQDKATAHGEIVTPTEEVKEVVCVVAAGSVMSVNRLKLPLNKDEEDALQRRLGIMWGKLKTWEAGKPIAGLTDATPSNVEMGARAALVTGAPPGGGWAGWAGCEGGI